MNDIAQIKRELNNSLSQISGLTLSQERGKINLYYGKDRNGDTFSISFHRYKFVVKKKVYHSVIVIKSAYLGDMKIQNVESWVNYLMKCKNPLDYKEIPINITKYEKLKWEIMRISI